MVMTIWRNMGTLMIIFLAGLQAIPEELKEAAAIDGAGKWRTFRSITLPLLKPTRCWEPCSFPSPTCSSSRNPS